MLKRHVLIQLGLALAALGQEVQAHAADVLPGAGLFSQTSYMIWRVSTVPPWTATALYLPNVVSVGFVSCLILYFMYFQFLGCQGDTTPINRGRAPCFIG